MECDLAVAMARRIGNPPQLWKSLVFIGDFRQAQGDSDAAQQAYTEALAVIDGVAAGLHDASLRETFLTSSYVQRIRRARTV
jgi:hypothetical protein